MVYHQEKNRQKNKEKIRQDMVLPQAVKAACGSSFLKVKNVETTKKTKWLVMAKRADFAAIAAEFHIDPVTARLLRNKDLTTVDEMKRYLYGSLDDLYDGSQMKDMEKAVTLLEEKIRESKRIRIMGDYDCDGIMSSFILLKGLTALGAEADVVIPDRIQDGYGLHDTMIESAKGAGVDTIVTCDNGIAAAAEIALAKSLGMTVILTDHHEVPQQMTDGRQQDILPPADAVVNPHRADCPYPFKGLCGAGVAYKLVELLYKRAGKSGIEMFIPFAAMATVTDIMELVDENRILVREGLRMFRELKNPGLLALMKATGIAPESVASYQIGFILGPCLNASGRLDTAQLALRLLMTEDAAEAERIAGQLIALNDSRKAMTEQGVREAQVIIETCGLKNDRVLVVYMPDCHESIAGIIAGRIRERYYRPVYVVTDAKEGLKGSGRSIDEYDMYSHLAECSELLERFGGHKMAAGISLKKENLETFRRKLNENCGLSEADLTEKIRIDVPMPLSYVTPALLEEFSLLEPFGRGNARPVFAEKNVQVLRKRLAGANKKTLFVRIRTQDYFETDAVCFNEGDVLYHWLESRDTMSILYSPQFNTFRGVTSIQFRINGYC